MTLQHLSSIVTGADAYVPVCISHYFKKIWSWMDNVFLFIFSGSDADILLVYRKKDRRHMIVDALYSTCYSHHQKCIMVDAEHPEDPDRRRMVAFMGGLDVAQGRYDTPEHPLFSTLQTKHQADFYQNCVTVPAEMGPRQPWHDIHCKVMNTLLIHLISIIKP